MKAYMLKGQIEAMMTVLGLHGTVAFSGLILEIKGASIRTTQKILADYGVSTRLTEEGEFGGQGTLAVFDFSKKLLSTKKLVETMKRIGHALPTNDKGEATGISTETYGKKTQAYLYTKDMAERAEVERKLTLLGCNVSTDYSPRQPIVDVQVSYKKAFGWNS